MCRCKQKPIPATVTTKAVPEPSWLISVPDYEGMYTTSGGIQLPFNSGAFFTVSNSGVIGLLDAGETVVFYDAATETQFNVYNNRS